MDIGCSAGSDTKTVIALEGFGGDGDRMAVALAQSAHLAAKAAERGNRVMVAVLGECGPGARGAGVGDSAGDALKAAREGVYLSEHHAVKPEDVLLLSGKRELAWVRLANRAPESRELALPEEKGAAAALLRKSPFAEDHGTKRYARLRGHDESMSEIGKYQLKPPALAVVMVIKIGSIVASSMDAPGLLGWSAARVRRRGAVDQVSVGALASFLSSFDGSMKAGLARLLHEGELTPEGIAVAPAAGAVVADVLGYARGTMVEYMRRSRLIAAVKNAETDADAMWFSPNTTLALASGKLLAGTIAATLDTSWVDGPVQKLEWATALNHQFSDFVARLSNGTQSTTMLKTYAALSMERRDAALPLQGLAQSPAETAHGFASRASRPFGTLERRVLVREAAAATESDLLAVLEEWVTVSTREHSCSTYWGVATWCGSTKADIERPVPRYVAVDELGAQLRAVSVTLASLLTARVNGRAIADFDREELGGVLGPVVVTAKRERMRLACFSHRSVDAVFAALLPESFVQFSFDDRSYDFRAVVGSAAPMLASEGFTSLPDDAVVQLGFPGLSEAEASEYRTELGTRLWAVPRRPAAAAAKQVALRAMRAVDEACCAIDVPGSTVFYTRQSSDDPLAGLHISLSSVPDMPARITIDCDVTAAQKMFRVVAREA